MCVTHLVQITDNFEPLKLLTKFYAFSKIVVTNDNNVMKNVQVRFYQC